MGLLSDADYPDDEAELAGVGAKLAVSPGQRAAKELRCIRWPRFPAAIPDIARRSSSHFHQPLDLGQTMINAFRLLAAKVHNEAVDADFRVLLHGVDRHRGWWRDD